MVNIPAHRDVCRANSHWIVGLDGHMVGFRYVTCDPYLTAGLTRDAIPNATGTLDEFDPGHITRQSYTAITSLCVKCNLISRGACPSLKWQRTASRT